ncbi:YgjV family protein [Vibrio porteresiae]|uniref:YgjV family protein n=1 Tax=Vibrio porteresiae DSM 19223 TaxID=1123496 RepID=A0ABZ0QGQ7_9VIBR|nr:YgjV family protein [Vibrio porteresiae]WPC75625.1 YgjV family protein [Vibrio porteresiae DSM 19223]
MDMNTIEIMGYAASIMVALSLTMKDIVKLRIINFIGCVLFCIYASIIGAWPVVATNAFIAVVNIYYLAKLKQANKTQIHSAA